MSDATFKLGSAGFVPPKVVWNFRGLDFSNNPNANCRNEASVTLTCGGFHLLRDSFDVRGTDVDQGKGYLLEITVDSWVRPLLWNRGSLRFEYDAATDRWTMSGSVADRAWDFCDARAVVDRVVAGLRCLAGDAEVPGSAAAEVFAKSLEAGAQRMIEGAKAYEGDCTYSLLDPADRAAFMD